MNTTILIIAVRHLLRPLARHDSLDPANGDNIIVRISMGVMYACVPASLVVAALTVW